MATFLSAVLGGLLVVLADVLRRRWTTQSDEKRRTTDAVLESYRLAMEARNLAIEHINATDAAERRQYALAMDLIGCRYSVCRVDLAGAGASSELIDLSTELLRRLATLREVPLNASADEWFSHLRSESIAITRLGRRMMEKMRGVTLEEVPSTDRWVEILRWRPAP